MKGLGDDLAANAVVFENGAIADEVGFFDTNAGAEADYSSDWATAESGFDTSSADIYSTFWKAENDDRVTALAGFATEMGTPRRSGGSCVESDSFFVKVTIAAVQPL